MNLKNTVVGKRLMLLGGVMDACDIVKQAHDLGIEVYETDYLVDSPAKAIVDKSFMTSCTDVPAVVDLCKRENVDGVFTGYTDSLLPFAQRICAELNFPFWGGEKNIQMCVDKELFKTACEEAGVPVIPSRCVDEKSYAGVTITGPVVVKPVDNSGSRGVFKCYSQAEYLDSCQRAFSYSKKKVLSVERLMDLNAEFSVYYLLYNGEAYMVGMGDRYVSSPNPNTAPRALGMRFPSLKMDLFLEKMDSKIRHFFSLNGMKNGFVFLQGFCEGEEFFINEIGYRLNGGFTYKVAEKYTGVNVVHLLLQYSLTGVMDASLLSRITPHFEGVGFLLTLTVKNGTIGNVCGIEEINAHRNIYEFCQLKFVGSTVAAETGTSAQVFAYAIITAKDCNELRDVINFVKQHIKVFDKNGDSMLNQIVDASAVK